jgi:hypothetical protein
MNTLRSEIILIYESLVAIRAATETTSAVASTTRRCALIRDPDPFGGEEKDALKRYDAFSD